MDKGEYYKNSLALLNKHFPEAKTKGYDEQAMEIKMTIKGYDEPVTVVLNTPYSVSQATNFTNWEEDLLKFYSTVSEIKTDFSEESLSSVKSSILPQIKSEHQIVLLQNQFSDDEIGLVTKAFRDNIVVAYVIDQPKGFVYITENYLKKWKITPEELDQIALGNLAELSVSKEGPRVLPNDDGTKSYLFESLDGYDAARILLDYLHVFLKKEFNGPYLIGIAHRDSLFATPLKYEDRLTGFLKDLYEKDPHPISPHVLRFE